MVFDAKQSKQFLLERFFAKGVSVPYWFTDATVDTGLEIPVLSSLCSEMRDEGYVDYTGQEASLTNKGHTFYLSGGYFPESSKWENNSSVTITPRRKQATAIVYWLRKFIKSDIGKAILYIGGALLIAWLVYYFRLNGNRN